MSTVITVTPTGLVWELLLTASTGISHHDPAVQDESNRLLFNRQKQALPTIKAAVMPNQAQIDAVCAANPVPGDVAELMHEVAFPEFVACCLCRLFMDLYNSNDGTGLFEGMERYARLEARARQAAIAAPSLSRWWDRLVSSMNVPVHGGDHDRLLLGLLSVPTGLQQQVLRVLTDDYRSIVALARYWHTEAKAQSEEYAAKAGRGVAAESVIMKWDADSLAGPSDAARVVDVPAVSGNSLRHQVVREPGWLHLCRMLELPAAWPGRGPVPDGVEAIFENGGNIEAGAKQPSNVHGLAWAIRERYPLLDLLGGVTDSFDLGESRLKVAGWLVCAENRAALKGSPAYDLPGAQVSVFDLLDDVTHTRQASGAGLGQMIYSFETLCPGTQVLCRLVLDPCTPTLTQGAMLAAVGEYLRGCPTAGGQASRGFGWMQGEIVKVPASDVTDAWAAYESYLVDHREELRAGMIDGTMGTGSRVLT